MRCLSCNTVLNKYEATRKYTNTGEFLDLCSSCQGLADLSDIPLTEGKAYGWQGSDDYNEEHAPSEEAY